MLQNVPSRQVFVDLGYAVDAAEQLKECETDEQFLLARVLFLPSYTTSVDYGKLIQQHGLADSIIAHLTKYSHTTWDLGEPADPGSMAMSELLRLLFNIQHFHPGLRKYFTRSLSTINTLLLDTQWPSPVLQAPLSSVINALLGLDLKASIEALAKDTSATTDLRSVVERLVQLLDRATVEHDEKDLEQAATPLCTLLRKVYALADTGTRAKMQKLILPTDQDREKALGHGNSFSARLLRLTSSSQLPTLRDNLSNLLYELSEQDPERFVYNVGYGHASGFLLSHNIPVPVDAGDHNSNGNLDNSSINPVTGQKLASENNGTDDLPEMTEEEKEREAERLFVLFERLKATGVVDVKNPVEEYRDKE